MAAPEVKAAAAAMAGSALVLKVDTEANPDLAQRFRITSIPTFAVFSSGALARSQPGLMRRTELELFTKKASGPTAQSGV
jgi:thioredoxin 2